MAAAALAGDHGQFPLAHRPNCPGCFMASGDFRGQTARIWRRRGPGQATTGPL